MDIHEARTHIQEAEKYLAQCFPLAPSGVRITARPTGIDEKIWHMMVSMGEAMDALTAVVRGIVDDFEERGGGA